MSLQNPSCAAAGSLALMEALKHELAARGLPWQIERSVCLGHCSKGPNLKVRGGDLLHHCRPEEAAALVERLLAECPDGADPALAPAACDWPAPGS